MARIKKKDLTKYHKDKLKEKSKPNPFGIAKSLDTQLAENIKKDTRELGEIVRKHNLKTRNKSARMAARKAIKKARDS